MKKAITLIFVLSMAVMCFASCGGSANTLSGAITNLAVVPGNTTQHALEGETTLPDGTALTVTVTATSDYVDLLNDYIAKNGSNAYFESKLAEETVYTEPVVLSTTVSGGKISVALEGFTAGEFARAYDAVVTIASDVQQPEEFTKKYGDKLVDSSVSVHFYDGNEELFKADTDRFIDSCIASEQADVERAIWASLDLMAGMGFRSQFGDAYLFDLDADTHNPAVISITVGADELVKLQGDADYRTTIEENWILKGFDMVAINQIYSENYGAPVVANIYDTSGKLVGELKDKTFNWTF